MKQDGNTERGARPVILCLSSRGYELALKLRKTLDADIHGHATRCPKAEFRFTRTTTHIADLFCGGRPLIGICAAGILIRAVAPHIGDKGADAPLVAVSESGDSVVPLISGHSGAIALAQRLAEATGGHAAITTAGDTRWRIALDEPPAGWRLANPEAARSVMPLLLAGDGARIEGECAGGLEDWLEHVPRGKAVKITATRKLHKPADNELVYCPRDVMVGAGCIRDCAPEELTELVMRELASADINQAAIAGVFSIDLKADEPALHALAAALDVPYRVYDAKQLAAQAPNLENPSATVEREVGTPGVAEAAALAAAGEGGTLIHPKVKSTNATMALALAQHPAGSLEGCGRKTGSVNLVGIGPGKAEWRTPEASRIIQNADELVGYGFYIDLLGPAASGRVRRDFELGEEEARCRYALEQAATGKDVAIICSGDAGIYAMASLVYELLDRPAQESANESTKERVNGPAKESANGPSSEAATGSAKQGGVSPAARRVVVSTAPGVSAMQAASARTGAVLGHDFCTISLSDLLTPWEQIERRIHAAGSGDFVVAFYNPVSRRRRTQLARARDILLGCRGADTPVILAHSLGREESLVFCTLGELEVDMVDMMTTVIVGSSASRRVKLGLGDAVYTPRGYMVDSGKSGSRSPDSKTSETEKSGTKKSHTGKSITRESDTGKSGTKNSNTKKPDTRKSNPMSKSNSRNAAAEKAT